MHTSASVEQVEVVDGRARVLHVALEGGNGEILDFDAPNQQAVQMDKFAVNILENTESIISGEEGMKDMKVLEAIYRSLAAGGKRVSI